MKWSKRADEICEFMVDRLAATNAKGAVVGLSGGLDSAVCATLAVRALGRRYVWPVFMPTKNTPEQDFEHAKLLTEALDTDLEYYDIQPIVNAFDPATTDNRTRGNITARIRMTVLYAYGNDYNLLVMGTSDRSELELGFFTKWGDGAADLLPIAHLYKTQVRELAREIGVPAAIIDKPSSPALLPGQTAEGEIGFSYDDVDAMLRGKKPMDSRLAARIEANRHKSLPIPRL